MTERDDLENAIAALEAQRSELGDKTVDTLVAAARQKLSLFHPSREKRYCQLKSVASW